MIKSRILAILHYPRHNTQFCDIARLLKDAGGRRLDAKGYTGHVVYVFDSE